MVEEGDAHVPVHSCSPSRKIQINSSWWWRLLEAPFPESFLLILPPSQTNNLRIKQNPPMSLTAWHSAVLSDSQPVLGSALRWEKEQCSQPIQPVLSTHHV